MSKFIYITFLASFMLLVTACGATTTTSVQTTTESNVQASKHYLFDQESIQHFTLVTTNDERTEFSLNDGLWGIDHELSYMDDTSMNEKIQAFVTIGVTESISVNDATVPKGEKIYTIETLDKTYDFYQVGDEYLVKCGDEWSKLSEKFKYLNDFSAVYFTSKNLLTESFDDLKGITITRDGKTYSLTPSAGELSAYEMKPFISGWYLHDYYPRTRSIEYYTMETIKSTINHLPAKELTNLPRGLENIGSTRISLNYKEAEEEFEIIYQDLANNAYIITKNELYYQVPKNILEPFTRDGLGLVDQFVTILPIEAVEQLVLINKINDTKAEFRFKHEIKDDQVNSRFYFNDQELDNKNFRTFYQYVSAIAPLADSKQKLIISDEPSYTIIYTYQSDEELTERILNFYSSENNEQLICEVDHQEYFTVGAQQLETIFEKLAKLK